MSPSSEDLEGTTFLGDRLRDGRPQLGSALADLQARVVAAVVHEQPERVGRYALGRTLGAGNFGTVYEAHDAELDRNVAVKIVHSRTPEARLRVVKEAQTLASLSHPHVVQVFETGVTEEDPPRAYVVMELVQGRSVGQWLRERARPWPEVVEVMRQAARGLQAAHGAGIVHGDFKPENVLLGDDGRARVVDFGLARFSREPESTTEDDASEVDVLRTSSTGVGGTPAYMAPEAFAGDLGEAIDQYSLCVTFYEGLFGERPFASAKTVGELVAMLHQQQPALPADRRGVPPAICRAVMRGLRRDPAARHADLGALVAALDDRGGARWSGLRVGLVVGALGVLTAGVALALQDSDPSPGPTVEDAAPVDEVAVESRVTPEIAALEQQRDELSALVETARYDEALRRAPALVERAEALEHPRLHVELMLLHGQAMARATDFEHAIPVVEKAYFLAQDHDLPRPMAHAASELVGLWGYYSDKYDDAHRWKGHAEVAFERAGLDPRQHPPYIASVAGLMSRETDIAGAIQLLREGIANVEAGEQAGSSAHAALLKRLSTELYVTQQTEEAIAVLERAIPMFAANDGEMSQTHARAVDNLGVYLAALERYDQALGKHEQALKIREAVLDPGHIDLGRSHGNLGRVHGLLGQPDDAFEHLDRAIELFTARLGAGNAAVAMCYEDKGMVHAMQGQRDEALAAYDKAARIYDGAGVIYAPTAERPRKAIEALGGTPPPRPSVPIPPEL